MMRLLKQTQPPELPAEALLARLRCRRAAIDLAAPQARETPPRDAVDWVYRRLNRRLRKQLEPFLELLAMRSLVLILRYRLAGETPPAGIQRNSLLNAALEQLALSTDDDETMLAKLEAALGKDYPFTAGLLSTYRNQGPGGLEVLLAGGILQYGLERSGRGVINTTLQYLVDMRNCLLINKLWRWQVTQAPTLSAGGTLAIPGLQHIWTTRDSDRLANLTARLAGQPPAAKDPIGMEKCLLRGLTRLLLRAGREPLGLAVIIEYLWRAQLALHNQVLRQALLGDREELLEEALLL